MSTQVDVVRVFTNERGEFGNELGIIEGPASQEIATRLGFSETVFISSVADGRATLRIFTPAGELPFAGHPTVGTAWWLAQRGTPVDVLVVPAGDVAVRYAEDSGAGSAEGSAELSGAGETWVTGKASWAPEFVWHPLASVAEVDALDPLSVSAGAHYFWAWTGDDAIRSRMFAPAMGIVEDEATGAAAIAITAQLERDLTISQGAGSVLRARFLGDRVEVGGRTVFDRTLELP